MPLLIGKTDYKRIILKQNTHARINAHHPVPAFFGRFADSAGLYQPVHLVREPGADAEGKASAKPRSERGGPNRQSPQTVVFNALHADIGIAQPAFLRSVDVFHLYFLATHRSLDIRRRFASTGRFLMRMYLGNKYFGESIGDSSTGYGF